MLKQFKNDDAGKLLLRLTIAILMLFHGVSKAIHPEALEFIGGLLANLGLPSVIAYGVLIGQIIAPVMIIVGFYSRVGALITTFTMVVAVLLVHTEHFASLAPKGGWALELQALYLFGALNIVLLGSGKYAIKPD
ncbi:MAG: DoxX family protein [Amphritea sp.]